MTAVYLGLVLALFSLVLNVPTIGRAILVLAAFRAIRATERRQSRPADLVDAYRMVHRARRGNW